MTTETLAEKIRALAAQAGFDIEFGEITAPNATINGDPMDVTHIVARFAALVAEDCAKAVAEAGPKEGPLRLVTDGFVAAIRARYGIKE